MRLAPWLAGSVMVAGVWTGTLWADAPANSLTLQPEVQNVYATPPPPSNDSGGNAGGVNIDLNLRYTTDDVYRGLDHNRIGNDRHATNFLADGELSFNLGKLPHPYVGIFSDVNNNDPVSRFQEVRPFVGLLWTVRPLIVDVGQNTYIYPERENTTNTSEVYTKLTLDDSYYFLTDRPILSPYIYAAYDYVRNNGWYLEAGVKHDFVIRDTGLTITTLADLAYIANIKQEFVFFTPKHSGLQHYDLGMIVSYSLNGLSKVPQRFGQFSLNGYLTYTDGITHNVFGDTVLWGGVGVSFHY